MANFNGSVLNFEVTEHLCFMILVMFEISTCKVGKHDAFEIPLTYVQHCQAQKNEVKLRCDCNRIIRGLHHKVTLEFSMNDDAPVNLSEMRFHIPGILSFLHSVHQHFDPLSD